MAINLTGIIAALPTLFDERGDLSTERMSDNLARWNQTDLRGYLILGSTGEFPHLTSDEKLSVIEAVRGNLGSDKLLLVGTGELSTRGTIESSRAAADRGADAAVVVTPFYYKRLLDEEHLAAHYLRVADRSPIPVIVYLIPQFSGVYLRPETIAELARHENIIGLKESSGDLAALRDVLNSSRADDFSVLVGAPTIFAEAIEAGAVGGVLAVACLAPTACVELYQACQRGDQARIRVLQDRLATLSRKTTVNGIGHLKAALDLVGLYGYLPRSPLPAPNDEERREIDAALGESGFFDRAIDGLTWIERHELHDLEFAD